MHAARRKARYLGCGAPVLPNRRLAGDAGGQAVVDDAYRPSGAVLHTGLHGNSRFCPECGQAQS